jgi:fructose-bisphosphate aldolase class 1
LTTAGLETSISGAILYDETIRQAKKDGTSFIKVMINAGIIPGIKADTWATDLVAAKCNSAARQGKHCDAKQQAEPALVGSGGLHSHLGSQD